ncbi:MAG: cytochrome c [Xanthomonadales bacterium]|nr:cytochrome c [Xanthomonadales bacterium]
MDRLMAHGETVYTSHCATCHQADGAGLPPAFPGLAGSSVTTGPREGVLDIVLNGKDGTAMQAWSGMLPATDIAAVVTYIRNSFGNDQGDSLQPADVAQALGDDS